MNAKQMVSVAKHALISAFINFLKIKSLSLVGPGRFMVLFEHSHLTVFALVSWLFFGAKNSRKSRGGIFFLLGIIFVLFFDHDHRENPPPPPAGNSASPSAVLPGNSFGGHSFFTLGLSDHKGGVLLLLATLLLDAFHSRSERELCYAMGGAKQYNAVKSVFQAAAWLFISALLFLVFHSSNPNKENAHFSLQIAAIFVGVSLLVFVLDFYVEAYRQRKFEHPSSAYSGSAGGATPPPLFSAISSYSAGGGGGGSDGPLSLSILCGVLLLSLFWNHPLILSKVSLHKLDAPPHLAAHMAAPEEFPLKHTQTPPHTRDAHTDRGGGGEFVRFNAALLNIAEHRISTGFVMAGLLLFQGSSLLSASAKFSLSAAGDSAIAQSSHSALLHLHTTLREVLASDASRKIFYFLCLNFSFAFVELIYGFLTNSLGLISDGFHMVFDSSALIMGLYASVISQLKPTTQYSYGYSRIECVSGFVNACFLIVISLSILIKAVERLVHPPAIQSEKLLVISVLGLLVNLVGLFSIGHAHTHSHGTHSHAHTHSHGHAHPHTHNHSQPASAGGAAHSHANGVSIAIPAPAKPANQNKAAPPPPAKVIPENANIAGVYLHVMADTLGSVGVIISSFLIERYRWFVVDPICSLFVAALIFRSVLPLLRDTAGILCLRAPPTLLCLSSSSPSADGAELYSSAAFIVQWIQNVTHVKAVKNALIWQHSSAQNCLSIRVVIADEATEQLVLNQIESFLRKYKFEPCTIQIEKEGGSGLASRSRNRGAPPPAGATAGGGGLEFDMRADTDLSDTQMLPLSGVQVHNL